MRAGAFMFTAALAGGALLAGCGRDEANDGDIFLRDVPEQEAPLRPAPEVSDIRPAPDLDEDEMALAMMCASSRGMEPEICGCVAAQAAFEFGGRDLAWFAARLTGDAAEAARVERGLPDSETAELEEALDRFMAECR